MSLFKHHKKLTIPLERIKRPFELFTDQELIASAGKALVWDIECYQNYFLAAFKCVETNKIVYFEKSLDAELNIPKLMWVLRSFILVGFNSLFYDSVLIWLACTGASTDHLKAASDDIIKYGKRKDDIENAYRFKCQDTNQVDLINVAPLDGSLKLYAARLHTKRLQELPINPDALLTRAEAETIRYYCFNDLDCTQDLLMELCPQIKLREELGKVYGQDLRSKSDAQIAETVIRSELAKITGHPVRRPEIAPGTTYKFQTPKYIRYSTKALQRVQELVSRAEFVVNDTGHIDMPPELENLEIKLGESVYKIGIGGLHSQEKQVSYKADENTLLISPDVTSFYPNIIRTSELYPKQCGSIFLSVYKNILDRRVNAKRTGDKVTADSLKIVCNSSFGKFGSKYSFLYSPSLMIQVTLTGQLALLMLIESIENLEVSVVSGNTDGIVIKCPKEQSETVRRAIKLWEIDTGFETEESLFESVYSRDVNNYVGLKKEGKFKLKGAYGEAKLSKNPVNLVCNDAVKELILNGVPVEKTIFECKDVRRFVTVRKVKGGAKKDNIYLGKIVRWYYAKNQTGTINYIISGNTVPRSETAKPLMDLPEVLPEDVNYQWYIDEANSILSEIAFYDPPKKVKQLKFF
jgi:hypothetical protein